MMIKKSKEGEVNKHKKYDVSSLQCVNILHLLLLNMLR